MPTPQEAQNSWAENTTGARWSRGVENKQGNYSEGVANFLGVDPGQIATTNAWVNGVNSNEAQTKYENHTGQAQAETWYNMYRAAELGNE